MVSIGARAETQQALAAARELGNVPGFDPSRPSETISPQELESIARRHGVTPKQIMGQLRQAFRVTEFTGTGARREPTVQPTPPTPTREPMQGEIGSVTQEDGRRVEIIARTQPVAGGGTVTTTKGGQVTIRRGGAILRGTTRTPRIGTSPGVIRELPSGIQEELPQPSQIEVREFGEAQKEMQRRQREIETQMIRVEDRKLALVPSTQLLERERLPTTKEFLERTRPTLRQVAPLGFFRRTERRIERLEQRGGPFGRAAAFGGAAAIALPQAVFEFGRLAVPTPAGQARRKQFALNLFGLPGRVRRGEVSAGIAESLAIRPAATIGTTVGLVVGPTIIAKGIRLGQVSRARLADVGKVDIKFAQRARAETITTPTARGLEVRTVIEPVKIQARVGKKEITGIGAGRVIKQPSDVLAGAFEFKFAKGKKLIGEARVGLKGITRPTDEGFSFFVGQETSILKPGKKPVTKRAIVLGRGQKLVSGPKLVEEVTGVRSIALVPTKKAPPLTLGRGGVQAEIGKVSLIKRKVLIQFPGRIISERFELLERAAGAELFAKARPREVFDIKLPKPPKAPPRLPPPKRPKQVVEVFTPPGLKFKKSFIKAEKELRARKKIPTELDLDESFKFFAQDPLSKFVNQQVIRRQAARAAESAKVTLPELAKPPKAPPTPPPRPPSREARLITIQRPKPRPSRGAEVTGQAFQEFQRSAQKAAQEIFKRDIKVKPIKPIVIPATGAIGAIKIVTKAVTRQIPATRLQPALKPLTLQIPSTKIVPITQPIPITQLIPITKQIPITQVIPTTAVVPITRIIPRFGFPSTTIPPIVPIIPSLRGPPLIPIPFGFGFTRRKAKSILKRPSFKFMQSLGASFIKPIRKQDVPIGALTGLEIRPFVLPTRRKKKKRRTRRFFI